MFVKELYPADYGQTRSGTSIAWLSGRKGDPMHDSTNAWKGLAAGLAGGLAASFVMTQFQELSTKLERKLEESRGEGGEKGKKKKGEDATVKAASKVSRNVLHHPLTPGEKKKAGPAVHYGFGTLTGAAYGVLAELVPGVTRGAGAPFGTALWVGADEIAVPAFGLSGPPWESPPAVHVKALAAHLVYGVAAEGVRKLVRRAL
jgi:putative membrane protein